MARSYTVTLLIARVRYAADIVSVTTRHPDADLIIYLDQSYSWLYNRLASVLGYYESTQSITSVAGTATYAVDATYYKTIGVDYKLNSDTWVPLKKIHASERNDYPVTGPRALAYRIVGSNVTLYPAPDAASQTYRHLYVPMPAKLTTGSDTVDGIAGWEEAVVLHAAIKVLRRDGLDTKDLERDLARELQRMDEEAASRDLQPGHVAETDLAVSIDPASESWYRGY